MLTGFRSVTAILLMLRLRFSRIRHATMTRASSTIHVTASSLCCLLAALCSGCAGFGSTGNDSKDAIPYLNPGRNQIIAWVPREQAQTATVAQAMAHIALTRAKQATESELCEGTWLFSGKQRQDEAPQLSVAPAQLGGFNGWHVRINWDPQVADCGISTQTYALSLSKHLPAWMMTQSGQPLALYHQGSALYRQDNAPLYALALQDRL